MSKYTDLMQALEELNADMESGETSINGINLLDVALDAYCAFKEADVLVAVMSDFEEWEVNFGGLIDEQEHSIAVAAFNAGAAAQIEKDAVLAEQYWGIAAVNKIAAAIRAQLKP